MCVRYATSHSERTELFFFSQLFLCYESESIGTATLNRPNISDPHDRRT
jgi:hypothetical protein